MGPLDQIYEHAVRQLGESQGWEFVYRIISGHIDEEVEDARRRLFSLEGAYANDLAKIISEFPGWNIRFDKKPDGTFSLTANVRHDGPDEEDDAKIAQIRQQQGIMELKFREAFQKHRKGWTAHGAEFTTTSEITKDDKVVQ